MCASVQWTEYLRRYRVLTPTCTPPDREVKNIRHLGIQSMTPIYLQKNLSIWVHMLPKVLSTLAVPRKMGDLEQERQLCWLGPIQYILSLWSVKHQTRVASVQKPRLHSCCEELTCIHKRSALADWRIPQSKFHFQNHKTFFLVFVCPKLCALLEAGERIM